MHSSSRFIRHVFDEQAGWLHHDVWKIGPLRPFIRIHRHRHGCQLGLIERVEERTELL